MAKLIIARATVNQLVASSVAQQNEIAAALGSKNFEGVSIPAKLEVTNLKNFSVTDDGVEVTVEINDKLIFAVAAIAAKWNSLAAACIKAAMALGIVEKFQAIQEDSFAVAEMFSEEK